MSELLFSVINMSISAGWIVLAVLLLRILLKKAPKWITVLLWGIVAIRLICPFTFESTVSLIPSSQTINPEIIADKTPEIDTGIQIINDSINPVISNTLSPIDEISTPPLQTLVPVLTWIWIVGITVMLIYTVISFLRIKAKTQTAILLRDNIYQCETVISPFVFGIIKPRIYLPFNISYQDIEYVVSHEKAHIHRKDHWWKPLGFILLTIHWFNPLIWLSYVLLCRDIELACDEKVVKNFSNNQKADYSQALLNCSINRYTISSCPLAFSEVSVKQRIKSILSYKKSALWISITAILLCIALAISFLTNPVSPYKYRFTTINKSSDISGIEVDIESIWGSNGINNPYINIKWINNTDTDYSFSGSFKIYKYTNDNWQDTLTTGEISIPKRFKVSAHSSEEHNYDLWNIDIRQKGTYLLESQFTQTIGDIYYTTYYATVEFKITKVPKPVSNWSAVEPEQILYNNQGIKNHATTIRQCENKNHILDKNSVLNVTWFNGSGRTLTINTAESTLNKNDSNYKYTLNNSEQVITMPADSICNVTYNLEGLPPLTDGRYVLRNVFVSESGHQYIERTVFTISNKQNVFVSRGNRLPIEGVTAEVTETDIGNDIGRQNSIIYVNLSNTTDTDYIYTPEFCIYKKTDNTWHSTQTTPINNYKSTYLLSSGMTVSPIFKPSGFDISQPGEYLIEIYLYSSDGASGYVSAEFTLTEKDFPE